MAFLEAFPYYPATVVAIRDETPHAKTFQLEILTPWTFRAGQHAVIRLTDAQGYMAARDYSISSAPSSGIIEITVAHAPHGEVSSWLHERVSIGDAVEVSKPLGTGFSWHPDEQQSASLVFIAGGIGITPLMSILRELRHSELTIPVSIAYSVRTRKDLCFYQELKPSRTTETLSTWITREDAPLPHHTGRVTASDLTQLIVGDPTIFVCGPTAFVDHIEWLLYHELGVEPSHIKTERFG